MDIQRGELRTEREKERKKRREGRKHFGCTRTAVMVRSFLFFSSFFSPVSSSSVCFVSIHCPSLCYLPYFSLYFIRFISVALLLRLFSLFFLFAPALHLTLHPLFLPLFLFLIRFPLCCLSAAPFLLSPTCTSKRRCRCCVSCL